MHVAALPDDGVAVWRECAPERLDRIEPATVLSKAHGPEIVGPFDDAGVRSNRARKDIEQGRLAAAVLANEADSRAAHDREVQVTEERAAPERFANPARDEELLRRP